jgi:exopolysaccharide production protein ExoQ
MSRMQSATRSRWIRFPPIRGLDRWWVAVGGLGLLVASDWQWRRRAFSETLAARADLAILLEIAVYGVVAVYLIVELLGPPRRGARPRPLMLAMWGFGGVTMISALWAPTPAMALVRGLQLIILCVLCQAVASHATRDHLHRFAHAYLVLCAASVVMGIVMPFQRSIAQAARFTFLYVHPVYVGSILGIGAVCGVVYVLASHRRDRWAPWPTWVYGGMTVLVLLGLVGTITRAAIAAGVVGCGVAALLISPRRQKLDLLVFGAAAIALVAMFAGGQIVSYLERGQSVDRLLTLNSRTTLWEAATDRFIEQPWLGHGVTAARSLFLEDIGLGGAHNALVEVAVNTGVAGLLPWMALLVLLVAGLVRLRAPVGQRSSADVAIMAGTLAFIVVNGISMEGAGAPANTQITWLLLMAAWMTILTSPDRIERERSDVLAYRRVDPDVRLAREAVARRARELMNDPPDTRRRMRREMR